MVDPRNDMGGERMGREKEKADKRGGVLLFLPVAKIFTRVVESPSGLFFVVCVLCLPTPPPSCLLVNRAPQVGQVSR